MYNKLFTKILDSSIWLEPLPTRIVWITLLAAMDEDGYAHFSAVENLASRARVTVTQCNAAITTLSGPDKNSCDPEFGGRRIERVPGGYIILNAGKYRGIANTASRRESTRLRVQRFRDKKANPSNSEGGNADVTPPPLHPASVSASENAIVNVGGAGGVDSGFLPDLATVLDYANGPAGIPKDCAEAFWNEMEGCGWRDSKNRPIGKWRNALNVYAMRWRANNNRPKTAFAPRPPTQSELFKQRDALESQLNILRNKHGEGPLARPWNDEDKQRSRDLKKRIAEINDQIAKGPQQ